MAAPLPAQDGDDGSGRQHIQPSAPFLSMLMRATGIHPSILPLMSPHKEAFQKLGFISSSSPQQEEEQSCLLDDIHLPLRGGSPRPARTAAPQDAGAVRSRPYAGTRGPRFRGAWEAVSEP